MSRVRSCRWSRTPSPSETLSRRATTSPTAAASRLAAGRCRRPGPGARGHRLTAPRRARSLVEVHSWRVHRRGSRSSPPGPQAAPDPGRAQRRGRPTGGEAGETPQVLESVGSHRGPAPGGHEGHDRHFAALPQDNRRSRPDIYDQPSHCLRCAASRPETGPGSERGPPGRAGHGERRGQGYLQSRIQRGDERAGRRVGFHKTMLWICEHTNPCLEIIEEQRKNIAGGMSPADAQARSLAKLAKFGVELLAPGQPDDLPTYTTPAPVPAPVARIAVDVPASRVPGLSAPTLPPATGREPAPKPPVEMATRPPTTAKPSKPPTRAKPSKPTTTAKATKPPPTAASAKPAATTEPVQTAKTKQERREMIAERRNSPKRRGSNLRQRWVRARPRAPHPCQDRRHRPVPRPRLPKM